MERVELQQCAARAQSVARSLNPILRNVVVARAKKLPRSIGK